MKPIEELIAKHSEGFATLEESNKLESLLKESREYRDLYREYMAIDSGLVDIVEEQMETSQTNTPSKPSAGPTNLILLSTTVAAVIALLAVLILKQEPKETPVTTIVNPPLEQAVIKDKTIYSIAVISKAIDLKSTKLQLGKGSLIRTGVFEIKSGIAQLSSIQVSPWCSKAQQNWISRTPTQSSAITKKSASTSQNLSLTLSSLLAACSSSTSKTKFP